MNRRIECRSEGCNYEVVFKTADGAFDERRASGRIPLSPPHRHSNAIQVSPYCKLHTCIHFHGDERCVYKKPSHDSVCAIHARCPISDCTQARAQFLEPNFDPLSNAVPKYARYDVCSDHQCKTKGCRTIVEGQFPYCVILYRLQGRPFTPLPESHLQDAGLLEAGQIRAILRRPPSCHNPRDWASEPKDAGTFCSMHTCRSEKCQACVDELAIFCKTHFKEHYVTQGKQLRADPPDPSHRGGPDLTKDDRPGSRLRDLASESTVLDNDSVLHRKS
ncbi:predicted protein [Chaetomium globosum CBS 148.51]|uniref:Uncharacterized protein n=1 Tax=Chaetomium globosum (strain ATCC 6205 / CBS 148.51 / DSM 1962 / NBRC 6347 / NRRL 1970) TaxID=306901 RepID=Q2GV80_CHAGB|nr:uncharacterized protein CHGG_08124 [Chaetomium globosum CBS 148.51]EAQ86871.1 predicted protein [Chaetomium globosum CBS 148.51]